ncbi:hypothetical protein [Novosphingobium sp.]|uniref:hypothetical protein n=1 Tax=Novosphingobium sp. TaxID=1874826 RepID=UPI003B528F35
MRTFEALAVIGCLTGSMAQAQAIALPQPEVSPAQAQVQPSPDAGAFALQLICRGAGEHKVNTFGSAFAFGSHGRSAYAVGANQQLSQFGEQMDINITGSTAKVRVPRRFLPPLHGGDGGWFEVHDLVINETDITGKVAINYANHPNLRLDRRAGSVALDGKVGSFAGECQKVDPNQRAF